MTKLVVSCNEVDGLPPGRHQIGEAILYVEVDLLHFLRGKEDNFESGILLDAKDSEEAYVHICDKESGPQSTSFGLASLFWGLRATCPVVHIIACGDCAIASSLMLREEFSVRQVLWVRHSNALPFFEKFFSRANGI